MPDLHLKRKGRCRENLDRPKSVRVQGALGLQWDIAPVDSVGERQCNRRQPIAILPLSVRVQAPIQLFMPLNECGKPILCRPPQIGVCESRVIL
ncbi:hypothetical protein AVEN_80590-1 [Araneus ventricosus]|uniref:Uncharacterized protein n=1 Tax=Araneus ventricosus TaxID=182803 RepID=A0A4Y2F4I4_ARAVE|nr:hypothetical protein AVEN_80590-1 [Araneus ventricosus]